MSRIQIALTVVGVILFFAAVGIFIALALIYVNGVEQEALQLGAGRPLAEDKSLTQTRPPDQEAPPAQIEETPTPAAPPTLPPTATVTPTATSTTAISATATPLPATETPGPAISFNPPPTPSPTIDLSTLEPMDFQLYGVTVVEKMVEIAVSLENLSGMLARLETANLRDEGWRLTVAKHIITIRLAHQALADIRPPDDLSLFHATLLNATGDCNEAGQYLASGLGSLNADHLEQALVLMASCNEKFNNTIDLVQELSVFLIPATATPNALAARLRSPTPTPLPAATETPTPELATATPEPVTATPEPPTVPPEPATATPTPTPEATPTPRVAMLLANEGNVNIRSGPDSSFEVVGALLDAGRLPIVGRLSNNSWWQVRLPNGTLGWIANSVSLAENAEDVPIVEAPPLPGN